MESVTIADAQPPERHVVRFEWNTDCRWCRGSGKLWAYVLPRRLVWLPCPKRCKVNQFAILPADLGFKLRMRDALKTKVDAIEKMEDVSEQNVARADLILRLQQEYAIIHRVTAPKLVIDPSRRGEKGVFVLSDLSDAERTNLWVRIMSPLKHQEVMGREAADTFLGSDDAGPVREEAEDGHSTA